MKRKKSNYNNLNPCAIGFTLGLFWAVDMFFHAWTQLTGNYFWWFTQTSNEIFLSKVPGFAVGTFGLVWAPAAGFIYGAVLGCIFVKVHNWFNQKYGSPCCK